MKRLFRAEPACIEAYNQTTSQTIKIMGDNLVLLEQWLNTGKDNDLIQDFIIK